jgi:SAM-dependent methyltransferase
MTHGVLSQAYQKVMGIPFVYNNVRPLLLGGLDLSPFYEEVQATESDTILDIGCGTGNALDYLRDFASYTGFDTDKVAIEAARRTPQALQNVTFHECECTAADVQSIRPTQVILCGVLHHLPDEVAVDLMRAAAASPRFKSMFTLDVVYLPGARYALSNVLAAFDRGKYVRKPEGYERLMTAAGLRGVKTTLLWNHPTRRLARYFTTTLERDETSP